MSSASTSPDQLAEYLPESMQELLPVIGSSAVVQLIRQWGGTSVYVPTPNRCGPDHPLSAVIGHPAALALADYIRGDDLTIPIGRELASALQRIDIANLTRQGLSAREIARRHGITDRWVIVQRGKARQQGELEERQKTLF